MALRVIRFLTLWLSGMVLAPSLAHLFELPAKIGMDRQDYLVVQQIYRGWALFGILILPAILAILALAIYVRRNRREFVLALLALICLVAAQLLFWVFTFPANQQTNNWTFLPANWLELRAQWEYSHAAGAILNLIAFTLLTLSTVLGWSPRAVTHRDSESICAIRHLFSYR